MSGQAARFLPAVEGAECVPIMRRYSIDFEEGGNVARPLESAVAAVVEVFPRDTPPFVSDFVASAGVSKCEGYLQVSSTSPEA